MENKQVPKAVQRRAFKDQIEMAMAHDLPLVIHVKGYVLKDTWELLKKTLVRLKH